MSTKLTFKRKNREGIKRLNPAGIDRRLKLPGLESQIREQDRFNALLHRSRARDAGRNLNLVRCFD